MPVMKQPETYDYSNLAITAALVFVGLALVGLSIVVGRITKDNPPLTEEQERDARNG